MSQQGTHSKRSKTMTTRQKFWVYAIVLFFLIVPILITLDVFTYYSTSIRTVRVDTADDIFWGGYFLVVPALVFYYIQKRHLQFHVLNVQLDASNFQDITLGVAKQLEWKIIEHSDHHLVAKNKWSWRSFGERITIIREGEQLLFNSVGDPDNLYTIPYAGLNRRFQIMFEELAIEALANKCVAKTNAPATVVPD